MAIVALFELSWTAWNLSVLQPVLEYYCKHNVKGTFEFVEILFDNPIPPTAHMCSFDDCCKLVYKRTTR